MMKILLVGFSKQSAEVLSTLIAHQYHDCTCAVVERRFNDNLRLCLPILAPEHGNARAMIINMDGVGMMGYHTDFIKPLQAFIGIRAALLVTRSQMTLWQNAQILPDGLLLCLKSPFSKENALAAFNELIETAPKARLRVDEFYAQHKNNVSKAESTPTGVSEQKPNPPPLSAPIEKPQRSAEDTFLHQLIDDYFNIQQNKLLHELLDVSLAKAPTKIMMGSQVVYINHQQNVALVNNLARLIDYCGVVKNFAALSNITGMTTISNHEFDEIIDKIPANGYQQYALNTLLWRVYSAILPETIDIKEHQLMLKMRYMPNFANMPDIPEYVRSLVSSCIVAPRSIAQLRMGLEGLGGEDIATFNRVFLLAVLSGAADIDVLKQSLNGDSNVVAGNNIFKDANAGVESAKKTGFLKRLLGKLKRKP